jgi:hypothetical protein
MKAYVKNFIFNGLVACGFGPIAWAIVYAILDSCGVVSKISVTEAALEIVSVAILAFIAGGIGVVYRIERLPLAAATLIHALALYLDYIIIYLMNGWLNNEITPFVIFTVCFAVGFAAIWSTVYLLTKRSAERMNSRLAAMQAEEHQVEF